MDALVSRPVAEPLHGTLDVPGDKSISHRALMFGAIAEGRSHIRGLLEGEDCLATAAAMRALGVDVTHEHSGEWSVEGRGLHGLAPSSAPLDLGNSGTGMRLLCGLMAAQPFASTLVGDASLSRRPMRRVTEPLEAMGARIATEHGHAPLHISPAAGLEGIDYTLPVASAQLKSALLIAGLYASGRTRVVEPAPCRDHTERLLAAMGADVVTQGRSVTITPATRLQPLDITVPGDLSSAAFFLVAANLVPGSALRLPGVGVNPTRRGVIDILRAMGATIDIENRRDVGGEPVADLAVRHAPLRGAEVAGELVPLAIDEFPVLFVAAAAAAGESRFDGLAELRHKESDRIGVMVDGLRRLGCEAEAGDDWVRIVGGGLRGGEVDSHGDHRIAMAFAVAAGAAAGPVTVRRTREIATSFPGFVALANGVGFDIGAAA